MACSWVRLWCKDVALAVGFKEQILTVSFHYLSYTCLGKEIHLNPWLEITLKLNSQKLEPMSLLCGLILLVRILLCFLLPLNNYEINRFTVEKTIYFLQHATNKADTG